MYEIHREFVKTTFGAMDKNNDKTLTQDEFVLGMLQQLQSKTPNHENHDEENKRRESDSVIRERIIEKYYRIDSNNDAQVTPTEIEAEQNLIFVTG